jgi:SAM-dependent methyltransferase
MQVLVRTLLACCVAASSLAAQAQAPAMLGQQGLNDGMVASAALEVPDLVKRLGLSPGMTVADIGAGFGAWTVAFGKYLGPGGRVYATDIGERQLAFLREYSAKEGLTNVTVLAAGARSTNLPTACCDAILVRDAYHHFTEPIDVVRSLAASLKPGGRLAIVDFPPRPSSSTPEGVPANRGGHGVPIGIVIGEVTANGFALVSQESQWSPKSQPADLFLLHFRKN